MTINYIQIGAGVLIGILLCYVFPNLPTKLKEIASNFQKMQEKENATQKFQTQRDREMWPQQKEY